MFVACEKQGMNFYFILCTELIDCNCDHCCGHSNRSLGEEPGPPDRGARPLHRRRLGRLGH
eukprot:scaffold70414_cov47-Prasinocladus_malaysianus.AAC.1